MSAINAINPNAERTRQAQALAINVSASRGLAEVLKTNLGAALRGESAARARGAVCRAARHYLAASGVWSAAAALTLPPPRQVLVGR